MARYTLALLLLLLTITTRGDTSKSDLRKVTEYARAQDVYVVVQTGSPFLHTHDCDGLYVPKYNSISVICGKGTELDRALAVLLHELGHSGQSHEVKLEDHELIYQREVDAWNRAEGLARQLTVWSNVDKLEWEIMKSISLHSYRRKFQPTWNFIR